MAVTARAQARGRAPRSYELLTKKYGDAAGGHRLRPARLPLRHRRRGVRRQRARRRSRACAAIKQRFPRCKTVLGHLATSRFGLPEAGREVLNSVFLYHCVQAGLDLAIVNSEKLERYPSIPEEERRLSEDLLCNRGADPVAAFAAHFRDARDRRATKRATRRLPLAERLAALHRRGHKDGLVEDLELALKTPTGPKPLDIINGPLMAGMDEVGPALQRQRADRRRGAAERRGDEGRGRATSSRYMEKNDGARRAARSLLATVKGDVHDIGKNLVDIILANNGFEVVNLGIKVPREELIEAVQRAPAGHHRPLGPAREERAEDGLDGRGPRRRRASTSPMLVGGAALSPALRRPEDRRGLRGPGRLRAGRDDGARRSRTASRIPAPRPRSSKTLASERGEGLPAVAARRAAACRPAGVRSAAVRAGRRAPPGPPRASASCCRDVDLDRSGRGSTRRCSTASTWGCAAPCRRGSPRSGDRKCTACSTTWSRPEGASAAPGGMRVRARLPVVPGRGRGRDRSSCSTPRRGDERRAVHVPAPARRRGALDRRLRRRRGAGRARTTIGLLRDHRGRGHPRARRRAQGRGAATTSRATRSVRSPSRRPRRRPSGCTPRCAAPGASPTRPSIDDGPSASRRTTAAAATRSATRPAPTSPTRRGSSGCSTRGDRRHADGRVHDGPRGQRLRAGRPPPPRAVLQRRPADESSETADEPAEVEELSMSDLPTGAAHSLSSTAGGARGGRRQDAIWWNGRLVPYARGEDARPLARAPLRHRRVRGHPRVRDAGKGLAVFRLREHVERLFDSAKAYKIPMPVTAEQVFEALPRGRARQRARRVLPPAARVPRPRPARRLREGRPDRGDRRGVPVGRVPRPRRAREGHPRDGLLVDAAPPRVVPDHREGLGAVPEQRARRPRGAGEKGFEEAILLDRNGNVAEGAARTSSSCANGALVTPGLDVLDPPRHHARLA